MATLTEEQAKKMGEEYERLMKLAQQQLVEHKLWLRAMITDWIVRHEPSINSYMHPLLIAVEEISLELATVEPAVKEDTKPTVSVVYTYPDALHDFLSRADLPLPMRGALRGGITLGEPIPAVKA